MTDGIVFKSTAEPVLAAWNEYQAYFADVHARRTAVEQKHGRRLMLSRLGFGHGSRVVGFEGGDAADLPKHLKVGRHGAWEPRMSTKAGKELQAELDGLKQLGPILPGMPTFQLVGLRSLAPALHEHNGVVWARWADDIQGAADEGFTKDPVDADLWERAPLSEYFADREALEAAGVLA